MKKNYQIIFSCLMVVLFGANYIAPAIAAAYPHVTAAPAVPVISSFTPSSGAPGATVIITGKNLTGATAVSVGGQPAQSFTINSATQITTIAGNGTSPGGSGSVSVTIQNAVYSACCFTFVAPPTLSYKSPAAYTLNTPITTLAPSTDGSVASLAYGGVPATVKTGFKLPYATTADAAGNVYVADFTANTVTKLPVGGGAAVVVGSGFLNPAALAVDVAGNVYVADAGHGALKEIMAVDGSTVTISNSFYDPMGVAVDAIGNIFVSDYYRNNVSEIFVGSNTPNVIGTGFNHPMGIAVDTKGVVYVADSQNSAIKKIPAGGGTPVLLTDYLYYPTGVAVDYGGNIYVNDYGDNSVSILKIQTGHAEPATPVVLSKNLAAPIGFSIDNAGNLYLANTSTKAVSEIKPTGGYFINGIVPAGLTFNSTNGQITGTPTAITASQGYTVYGYNAGGGTRSTFSLTVNSPLNITVTNITATTATISYQTTSAYGRDIFIKQGSDGTASPVSSQGNYPVVGNKFNYNAEIGTSGWFCYGQDAYELNATSSGAIVFFPVIRTKQITVSGLTPGTTYRVTVVDYNRTSFESTGYNIFDVTHQYPVNFTTAGTPPAPVNSLYVPAAESHPMATSFASEKVEANNILSPNGDGINDIWIVKNISFYPNNSVAVYDKTGNMIFSTKNYANDWAGTYRGSTLNPGTYYYRIDLGNGTNMKGFITVVSNK